MGKMHGMEAKKTALQMSVYVVRMICFSIIAACPTYFARLYLIRIFHVQSRLIANGLPVLLCGLMFAAIGIFLLLIFKDETAMAALKKIKAKTKNRNKK